MTNEEITMFLSDHSSRRASGKPFTDEEYAEADAEDKAKMDDYAEFCAYLAEREAQLDEKELARRVKAAFSFKPADIVSELELKRPIFSASTNYGHFGKSEITWEKLDPKKLDKLKS